MYVETNFTDLFENFYEEETFTNADDKSDHEEVSSHKTRIQKEYKRNKNTKGTRTKSQSKLRRRSACDVVKWKPGLFLDLNVVKIKTEAFLLFFNECMIKTMWRE